MKILKWYFLLLLISSCFGSKDASILAECNTVATPVIKNNDTLLVCDVGKATQIITMPLSKLADYRLVRLENTTKEMMISPISSIYISENYIVTVGNEYYNQIKLFDKSGKFVRVIGKAGNGPGEFVPSVFRIVIEEQQDCLFVADRKVNRMMVYSLSTGQYICQIPFAHTAIIPSFIVNLQDSTLLVTHVPMDESPVPLWKQDFQGNIPITKQRFYMWGEYFTLTLSPEWLAEMAEKALAHPEYLKPGEKERLQTQVDSITEEDNTFIVYGKIK